MGLGDLPKITKTDFWQSQNPKLTAEELNIITFCSLNQSFILINREAKKELHVPQNKGTWKVTSWTKISSSKHLLFGLTCNKKPQNTDF